MSEDINKISLTSSSSFTMELFILLKIEKYNLQSSNLHGEFWKPTNATKYFLLYWSKLRVRCSTGIVFCSPSLWTDMILNFFSHWKWQSDRTAERVHVNTSICSNHEPSIRWFCFFRNHWYYLVPTLNWTPFTLRKENVDILICLDEIYVKCFSSTGDALYSYHNMKPCISKTMANRGAFASDIYMLTEMLAFATLNSLLPR